MHWNLLRFVIIMGEHEEWLPDEGYIANHFIRRYLLPDNIQTSKLTSNINREGLLTVAAPLKNSAITDTPNKSWSTPGVNVINRVKQILLEWNIKRKNNANSYRDTYDYFIVNEHNVNFFFIAVNIYKLNEFIQLHYFLDTII